MKVPAGPKYAVSQGVDTTGYTTGLRDVSVRRSRDVEHHAPHIVDVREPGAGPDPLDLLPHVLVEVEERTPNANGGASPRLGFASSAISASSRSSRRPQSVWAMTTTDRVSSIRCEITQRPQHVVAHDRARVAQHVRVAELQTERVLGIDARRPCR